MQPTLQKNKSDLLNAIKSINVTANSGENLLG